MVMRAIRGLPGGHQHPCRECCQVQKADLGLEQTPSLPVSCKMLAIYQVGGERDGGGGLKLDFLSVNECISPENSTGFPCLTDPAPNTETEKGDLVFWHWHQTDIMR